jgi:hypothetical protein
MLVMANYIARLVGHLREGRYLVTCQLKTKYRLSRRMAGNSWQLPVEDSEPGHNHRNNSTDTLNRSASSFACALLIGRLPLTILDV